MAVDNKDEIAKDLEQHQYIETEQPTRTGMESAASMDPERRKVVEKSMLRKLDARCSLFVLIYIMNCKYDEAYISWCSLTFVFHITQGRL